MQSSKKVTIKDVAQRAGVSMSIVSYVLNNTPSVSISAETRERVQNAAKELNYVPNALAQGMRQGAFPILGFLTSWDFQDARKTLEEVVAISDELQMSVLVCPYSDKQQFKYVKLYNSHLINGVILLTSSKDSKFFKIQEHIDMIQKYNIPAVIIGREDIPETISSLDLNLADSGRIATEYLIGQNHRKIAFLQPEVEKLSGVLIQQRLDSHIQCMRAHQLEPQIIACEDIDAMLDTVKKGTGPTAVIATKSDLVHIFLQHALAKGVSIPDELSLVSCNFDSYNQYSIPPVTSIITDPFNVGALATQMLLDSIHNKQITKEKRKMPHRVFEGASCKYHKE